MATQYAGPPTVEKVYGGNPRYEYYEIGQTAPAGQWRTRVDADTWTLERAATAGFATVSTFISVASTAIVINEVQANIDFRVESQNNANAFNVNAGTDSLGFGAAANSTSFLLINPTFTPAVNGRGMNFGGIWTTTPTSTSFYAAQFFHNGITTGGGSDVYGDIGAVRIRGGTISKGTGDSVTVAESLFIEAISGATDNFSIRVNTGPISTGITTTQNVTGSVGFFSGGIAFSDVANAWIDDATHGTGTVQHFIGNESIDTTASDVRLKQDIAAPVLDYSAWLRGAGGYLREFDWRPGHRHYGQGRNLGFVAQEFVDYAPQLVEANGESTWKVNYQYLAPHLLRGWLDHDARLETVEQTVQRLESQLESAKEVLAAYQKLKALPQFAGAKDAL